MSGAYDDIINLPHPEPRKHPRMSRASRAAQFSPFAALSGHEEALQEEARRTLDLMDTKRREGLEESEEVHEL